MPFAVQPESPPLRQDPDGVYRVGESRVLLELVLRAFQDGATAESIVQRYPTLSLGDVYATIGYYLHHRRELDEYLARYEREADDLRRRNEADQADLGGIRARLVARRQR